MGKIRVYELAKELGLENKEVIARAQELGVAGVKSHSNSLSDDEADKLRRSLIREAISNSPDSEKVTTKVDTETGEQRTVVERRKGDVVRRRRRKAAPEPEPVEELAADDVDVQEEPVDLEEIVAEEVTESVEELEEVTAADVVVEEVGEEESGEKTVGPRVLGKIDLPVAKAKPEKPKPKAGSKEVAIDASAIKIEDPESEGEEGDGRGKKGKKKRGRRKQFTKGQLVDYDGKPQKKAGRGGGRGSSRERSAEALEEDAATEQEAQPTKASKRVVKMGAEVITVGDLASRMSVKAGEVITKLIEMGMMATINQVIDHEIATIIADEFGYTIELSTFDEEEIIKIEGIDDPDKLTSRSPVVTVMGHVDHGKTSLLDCIRKASVADREHGGITQHIGAYSVSVGDGRTITFVDTPGHAAFTSMRARGAQITDIVVLVVAADDGVMPQTIEAINHAKAAEVGIVVAINKMDRPDANPDKIKQQLAEYGLQPEDWGGDVMMVPISALQGDGVEDLLESILLGAEMLELNANPECRVKGTIIEARQERGRGTVATVLVQAGTLNQGDIFVSGAEYGRVRSMVDHGGDKVETAGPSIPVEITGLNGVPIAGDDFIVVDSESQAKQVAQNRAERIKQRESLLLGGGPVSLEEFAKRAAQEEASELNIIVKADVQGSLEAVKDSVEKLSTEKVRVRVLHGAVGGVSESDVQLAVASSALIIGFGVRGGPRALEEADTHGVQVRFYRVIYELIDDVKQAMAGLLAPVKKEVQLGRAEVRDTFSVPKIGVVAGCYVLDGMIKRGAFVRLLRDSVVVHEGKMLNLRRFKDDVKEVQSGYECGISVQGYNDIKTGDVIEVFDIEEIAATLD